MQTVFVHTETKYVFDSERNRIKPVHIRVGFVKCEKCGFHHKIGIKHVCVRAKKG